MISKARAGTETSAILSPGHRTGKPYPRDAHRYGAHTDNGALIDVTSPLTLAIRTVLRPNGGIQTASPCSSGTRLTEEPGRPIPAGLIHRFFGIRPEHALQFATRLGDPLSANSSRTVASFFPNRRDSRHSGHLSQTGASDLIDRAPGARSAPLRRIHRASPEIQR
jgi:hypothetical protein